MHNDLRSRKLGSLLPQIAAELRAAVPGVSATLVFGSAGEEGSPRDLDLAVIVPDDGSAFETVRALAPVLARLTVEAGALVSCFPIKLGCFNDDVSQFVRNVKNNGRPI